MSQDTQTPAAPAAPKKSKKLLLIAGALVVLLAGGGGAYWMFAGGTADPAPEPAKPPAVVSFDPFVVNLADPGGSRFLRVTLGLLVAGEIQAKEFAEDEIARMRTRSSILELLSEQTAEQLVTAEGKDALKKAIAAHAAHTSEHLKVSDVLFTEFIVQ